MAPGLGVVLACEPTALSTLRREGVSFSSIRLRGGGVSGQISSLFDEISYIHRSVGHPVRRPSAVQFFFLCVVRFSLPCLIYGPFLVSRESRLVHHFLFCNSYHSCVVSTVSAVPDAAATRLSFPVGRRASFLSLSLSPQDVPKSCGLRVAFNSTRFEDGQRVDLNVGRQTLLYLPRGQPALSRRGGRAGRRPRRGGQ